MALIQCPDCGKDVSTLAPACPNCGRPIAIPVDSSPKKDTGRPQREGNECPYEGCTGTIHENGLCWLCGRSANEYETQGATVKDLQGVFKFIGMVITIFIFYMLLSGKGTTPPSSTSVSSEAKQAESSEQRASTQTCTINTETFACVSEEDSKKILSFAGQGDKEAFRKAVQIGLQTGACVHFNRGESVHIEETGSLLGGVIKVRRPGDIAGYWVPVKFVDTPPP